MSPTTLSLDPEPLSRLVNRAYEVPTRMAGRAAGTREHEKQAWRDFASEAARAFGCQLALVEYHDPQNPEANFVATGGLDGFEEVFTDARARNDDDHFLKAISHRPAGTVQIGAEIVPPSAMRRSPSFSALAMPWRLEHFLFGKIMAGSTGAAYFSLARTGRERPFAAGDKALVGELLLAHLNRSMSLQRELAAVRGADTLLANAMHMAQAGFVLFDCQGRPLLVNARAAEILARRDGLVLRSGELRTEGVAAQAMLRDGLAAALRVARGQLAPAPAPVPIPDDSGRECYRVSFSALKPLADVADLPRSTAVIATIHEDRRSGGEPLPILFRATYGLTRAEVSLCESLVAGRSLTESAAALGVSRNTAKTHLARIFDKTGVRSQVALLRVLTIGARGSLTNG